MQGCRFAFKDRPLVNDFFFFEKCQDLFCWVFLVIASVREPIRSWIDNVFGPVGVMQAAALGILHINYAGRNVRCDLVPADYTINHCIACSYAIAMKNKSG